MREPSPSRPPTDAALLARGAFAALPVDPADGLFRPGGWLRRIVGEPIQILGGGCALLLQVAHPVVAAGVAEHSNFRVDPFGRLQRTLAAMGAISFGDRAAAFAAVRGIERAHAGISGRLPRDAGAHRAGSPYSARDPEAMRWVWATLVDTAFRVYQEFVGAVPAAGRDEYYADHCAMARLLGIPGDHLPGDWSGFERSFAETVASDRLAVDDVAREIGHAVLHPPVGRSDARAARILTAALLPEPIRSAYGIEFGPEKRERYAALVRSVGRLRGRGDGAAPLDGGADPG